ncbi:preprotein translocase subunit SecG [Jannaschia sp. CCS1]|uniref:preprotein translocase subunit SecG n=1 Tax=Jannaschia sp. (strain CCS1) TaxID=290400 RepID=UPI000053C660|nr:preprotein translocase subunit SecG [Jannaschia sp. CCS1]ABD56097.1 protein translocase subunit secG [Jannaschia sp. CCS1]
MENVILVIHLILAICLIGVVLLQRSEGGGLGMGGGGGGGGGVMTGRQAATALGKLTWFFAVAFLATSITLTVIAAQNSAGSSLLDDLGGLPAVEGDADSALPPIDSMLPPIGTDGPALPPVSE